LTTNRFIIGVSYAIYIHYKPTVYLVSSMKAYEFTAEIAPAGMLEVPEGVLKSLPSDRVVRVIVLVNEPVDEELTENDLEFSPESFRQSWHEAMTGKTLPLSQLWEVK
jgi:hypothetical protein